MFCTSTFEAVWLIEPDTSRMITGSPLRPDALGPALAAAMSNLLPAAPASVVSGVPHIQYDGHDWERYFSGTPIAVRIESWSTSFHMILRTAGLSNGGAA